jgi:hypothetical protein
VVFASGIGARAFGSSVQADLTGGVAPGSDTLALSFKGTTPTGANFVGQIDWTITAGEYTNDFAGGANAQLKSDALAALPHSFSTYCIEGTEDVILGQTATWADGVVTLDKAPDPGDLSKTLDPTQIADLTDLWNLFHDGIGSDNVKSTAFQLAIWEIVDDDRNGLSADGVTTNSTSTAEFGVGTFEAAAGSGSGDASALTMAGTWLSDVLTDETLTPSVIPTTYTLYALAGAGTQDQLIAVPTAVAPLPAALPAGLSLMAALGFGRVIRRRLGH